MFRARQCPKYVHLCQRMHLTFFEIILQTYIVRAKKNCFKVVLFIWLYLKHKMLILALSCQKRFFFLPLASSLWASSSHFCTFKCSFKAASLTSSEPWTWKSISMMCREKKLCKIGTKCKLQEKFHGRLAK